MKSGRYLRVFGAVAIGHFKAEVVVLDVGDHLRMRFGDAAELRLPVAVEHHPVDLVLRRRAVGLPAIVLEVLKRTCRRGAGGIVGIEQRLDGPFAKELPGDAGGDAVAGHVGQLLIHELRGIGVTLADETGVEPLLGDALELAEQMQLRLLAGIAPLGVEQPLGDVEHKRGRAHVAQMLRGSGPRLRR